MSLCKTRNLDEDDDHPEGPIKDIIKLKGNSIENINENKKEKSKILIPKDSIYKEDEEIIKKEKKEQTKRVIEETINTDIQKESEDKNEEKINYKQDSTNELIKIEQNMNNSLNNNEKKEEDKVEEEKNINKINDEKENIENIIIDEKINNNNDNIENHKNGVINNDKKEQIINNEIKENHIEKEEEKLKIEIKEKNDNKDIIQTENNIKELEDNKKIMNEVKEEKVEIEVEKEIKYDNNDIVNKEKDNEALKSNQIKKEEKFDNLEEKKNEEKDETQEKPIDLDNEIIEPEHKNEIIEESKDVNNELIAEKEVKKHNEENIKEEKEEPKIINEEKKENEQEEKHHLSLENFLTVNDSLIRVININFESKGFSKSDIQSKFNSIFQSIPESKLKISHSELISNTIAEILSITLDSDRKDVQNFFKELFSLLNYDKEKIHELINKFTDNIEEQEKLKTRKLNRNIRSYIKDCKDKLNPLFKGDDLPSDRVVSFDKFNQIADEVGIQLKKEYMDILLYQMKMAVPKGRSIYDFNMIVIVDFLK